MKNISYKQKPLPKLLHRDLLKTVMELLVSQTLDQKYGTWYQIALKR